MKSVLITAFVAAGLLAFGAAQASPELAKSAGCSKCHLMDKEKKGAPAYTASAAKYKGKADAEATMLKFISNKDGDHPEMKANPDDAKAVVKWILTL
ncbi:MAG: c-type cytochrome [Rubrivivax sp.]|nr:c-type cytochrome [Rubrivivax sp.]